VPAKFWKEPNFPNYLMRDKVAPQPSEHPAIDVMLESHRGFNLRQSWHTLIERIWIVALCVLAGLFIALGYLARTPKTYQSHAVLEVDFQEPTIATTEDNPTRVRSMFLASQEALRTIEQNLTNRQMLARVIRSEGLAEDGGAALFGSPVHPNSSKSTRVSNESNSPAKAQPDLVQGMTFTPTEEALAGALSGMVKATIRRGTRLIDLWVTNRDPVMAQRLAGAVGREYIRNSIERRAAFSQETLRYLLEEEERLKVNLQNSEAAVAEYKAKTPDALQLGGGTVATGSQAGSGAGAGGSRGGLVEDKLQDLNNKLTAAKTDRLRLEGELRQIEETGDNVDALLSIPSISVAVPVNEARRTVTQLEADIATLALRYKDKHPKMMAARAALREAKETLRRAVVAQPAILRNAIDQAKATEKNFQDALQEQQGAAVALNRAAIGYQELARQAETDRSLYESVLRQIKAIDLTKDVKANAVSIAEQAVLPRSPINPIPSKTITLGLLGGLAVGLAFIFGADALDRSVKTVDQAEATLGLPVLAAIPETKGGEVKEAKTSRKKDVAREAAKYRLVDEAPSGPIAESFRNLRAALSLLGPEADRKVFLFTSALPNEGKSFTSVNYALALAQQGHRVLLVDGDLRRPSVHKVFRDATGKDEHPGIVDYLVGGVELKNAVRLVATVNPDLVGSSRFRTTPPKPGQLFILAGGQRAPNPAELLSDDCFKGLMKEASAFFNRIVIDSAPVLAVSDTLLMVPHVQTTCMVVRAAKTPRNAINRALTLLSATNVRPAGLVLNRLPRRRGAGYYYYYASHGYGVGGGSYGDSYGRSTRTASRQSGNGAANGAERA
jgi:polysaccharide biosynthesis transport protein